MLIAPTDGPAPTLAPDFIAGYEANDYYQWPTIGVCCASFYLTGIGGESLDLRGRPDPA